MFVLEAAAVHFADLEPHECVPGSFDVMDDFSTGKLMSSPTSNPKKQQRKAANLPFHSAWIAMSCYVIYLFLFFFQIVMSHECGQLGTQPCENCTVAPPSGLVCGHES